MPAIPYNPDIPQATDEPSASQPELLQNAQGINNWTNVDHYKFDENDAGKHRQVTLPAQADPTTAADEIALFCKNGPISGIPELFLRQQSNGAVIPVTEHGAGWTYLPSGLLLKWGSGTATGYQASFSFPTNPGIPVFTNVFFISVSPRAQQDNQLGYNQMTVLSAQAASNLGFFVNCFQFSNGNPILTAFTWFAIGN